MVNLFYFIYSSKFFISVAMVLLFKWPASNANKTVFMCFKQDRDIAILSGKPLK